MLEAFEARTGRAQKRPQNLSPKPPGGAFCPAVGADAESADETGRRARRRRFSGEVCGGGAPRHRTVSVATVETNTVVAAQPRAPLPA
eukprot:3136197-Alexandrium_andersonii.AAC.1